MDPLELNLEPDNHPFAFYVAFAELVDTVPHSDHKSLERLMEARKLGEQKCGSPSDRQAEITRARCVLVC